MTLKAPELSSYKDDIEKCRGYSGLVMFMLYHNYSSLCNKWDWRILNTVISYFFVLVFIFAFCLYLSLY